MEKKFRFWVMSVMIMLIGFLPGKSGLALPSAEIVIHAPGSESRVTSPIDITASVTPGADDLIRVTLIDQGRNLLARQLIHVDPDEISATQFSTQLRFEIPTESTEALLILGTKDAYNRPISLRAIPLTLNLKNEVVLEMHPTDSPWLIIDAPKPLSTHRGGSLTVSGIVTPISTKPLIFELITDSGGLIGSKQLMAVNAGQEVPFSVTLHYSFINTTRDVRLVVRQIIDPFGVDVALDSIPIFLAP